MPTLAASLFDFKPMLMDARSCDTAAFMGLSCFPGCLDVQSPCAEDDVYPLWAQRGNLLD